MGQLRVFNSERNGADRRHQFTERREFVDEGCIGDFGIDIRKDQPSGRLNKGRYLYITVFVFKTIQDGVLNGRLGVEVERYAAVWNAGGMRDMQGGETYVESLQVVVQGGLACSDKGYSILARGGVKNRACRGRWVATGVASHGGGLGCEKKG